MWPTNTAQSNLRLLLHLIGVPLSAWTLDETAHTPEEVYALKVTHTTSSIHSAVYA